MSLLVFGPTGQVGFALQSQAGPDAPYLFLGRDRADLRNPDTCAAAIQRTRPGLVINLAALHDGANTDNQGDAHLINAETPGVMAAACARVGAPMVHISTADVFDGSGDGLWKTTDTPAPITVLGRSKLGGEEAIRKTGVPHIILRTSWIVSSKSGGLVRRMLSHARSATQIEVPADQISGPTPAFDLARACQLAGQLLIDDKSLSGTYHYQGQPRLNLADFTRELMHCAGQSCDVIETTTDPDARRPLNTQLECGWTEATLGLRRPDWRRGLSFVLKDLRHILGTKDAPK